MIMLRLIFLEYPVRPQLIGCQIKAPVSMTKCSPFSTAPASIRWTPSSMCLFLLPPNRLHTLDFGGRLSLLFAVNFCRLHRGSSPWIFISPLTLLNVNSSFPVLLFISVAWWFDHAGNTRLAIALSLVLPQGHLLQKCYCLCSLTLRILASLSLYVSLHPLSLLSKVRLSFTVEPRNKKKNEANKTTAPLIKKKKEKTIPPPFSVSLHG